MITYQKDNLYYYTVKCHVLQMIAGKTWHCILYDVFLINIIYFLREQEIFLGKPYLGGGHRLHKWDGHKNQ